MKKLSVFSINSIMYIPYKQFYHFAERPYPPGESYSVEKITTDSYPNMRLRSQTQRVLGNKIIPAGGGNILMEVMLSISGNIQMGVGIFLIKMDICYKAGKI